MRVATGSGLHRKACTEAPLDIPPSPSTAGSLTNLVSSSHGALGMYLKILKQALWNLRCIRGRVSPTNGTTEGHFPLALEADRLFEFVRAVVIQYHRSAAYITEIYCLRSGSSRSEIRVLAGLVSSEGYEGSSSVPGLSPWLIDGCLLFMRVCFWVHVSPSYKDSSHNG